MLARLTNMLAGLWLIAAPWVLGHASSLARWNDVLIGAMIVVFAALGLARGRFRHLNTVLGAWLVLAPAVFGVTSRAGVVSDVITGILVFFVSLVPTRTEPSIRRGWMSTP